MRVTRALSLAAVVAALGCAPAEPAAPPPAPASSAAPCPSVATAADAPKPPADPELPTTLDAASLDRYLAAIVKTHGLVGLSVAVVRHGDVVLAKGYGKADLASGADVDADTAFGIGSVTKQFTCAAVLLLADDGKLAVTDKVAKYDPSLSRAKDITLLDLMNHVSGYPDYYPLDFVDARMATAVSPDEVIARYAKGKLDFEPGTRWSYSNTGYFVAGRVVEKVAKEPLGAFLARRVFGPLGMKHASLDPPAGAPGLARGHVSFAFAPPRPAPLEAKGWLYAAGGIMASAADLAKWDLALADGKLLSPRSRAVFTSPRVLADGSSRGYACGVNVSRLRNETLLTHSGSISGFHAYNTVIPRVRSAVVVLSNSEAAYAATLHDQLVGLVQQSDDGGVVVPAIAGASAVDVTRALIADLRAGRVDRAVVGADYAAFLDAGHLADAKASLAPLGEPLKVELETTRERGGMAVSRLRVVFKSTTASALLYRTPDGKVQELLVLPR
ncbi:MAG TPA: serine hydrolase domain-containing protein [Byssovorax sp.]|jgi:CubicO group peptidase (beta-lactamase class C family)